MGKLTENFGKMVFDDRAMRQMLSKDVYKSMKETISEGKNLDITVANAVANAMKTWATERGATHYTHWFQPLTGVTAEKHDSFLYVQKDGSVLEEFSGKKLIRGEPDASSFPSGGLRATFEARGYTAWDPTSYAFLRDNTLYIPTAFCAYGGELLDKKTPLLRSLELLSAQATRVLQILGYKDVTRVNVNVGAEQEYFLIDKEQYDRREDLKMTGRTLFGAPSPKGQKLDDHYFGSIRPRVKAFMEDLDEELWRLGIYANTEHNEAAPGQQELAPVFCTCNLACDQNQLTMDVMKKVADRHGLVCLLHEKPFKGVNGSGKHNNWSLETNTGMRLLKPGDDPFSNTVFLLFLSAVIAAVDNYQDLLRVSVASPANDHRLGGNEAPPAIISIYLGEELTAMLSSIEEGKKYFSARKASMQTGVVTIPDFKKDTTDRNRTSPFAFTGNKFEFRMLGSAQSISDPNTVLNTAVADTLALFAEKLDGKKEPAAAARRLVRDVYSAHKRIIFNGNNYSAEWVEEAKKRGLCRFPTAADAIPALISEKNTALFERYGIFSKTELYSRCEVMLENYAKVISIEALTMSDMARRQIIPAVSSYAKRLCEEYKTAESCGFSTVYAEKAAKNACARREELYAATEALNALLDELKIVRDSRASAEFCKEKLIPAMETLRTAADEAETNTPADLWCFPTYSELMFSV